MKFDKNKYKELNNILDDILNSKNSNFYTLAISWLHIPKAHSIFLKKYSNLFLDNNFFFYIKLFNKLFYNLSKLFINFLLNLFNFGLKKNNLEISNNDILIISHFLDPKFYNADKDFYFSDIDVASKSLNLKIKKIYFNYSKFNNNKIYELFKKNSSYHNTKIFIKKTNIINFTNIIFNILKESYRLFKLSLKKNDIERKIYLYSSIEAFEPKVLWNIVYSQQLRKILKIWNPKYLLLTYEVHEFERLFINIAKNINKKIICCGYHQINHTKFQYSSIRKLKDNYNPDIIFTKSNKTKLFIQENTDLSNTQIILLGQIKKKLDKKKSNLKLDLFKKKNLTILLVPEGIDEELNDFMNLVVNISSRLKNINFIFRPHPIHYNMIKFLKDKFKKFSNIKISKMDSSDLINSDIMIYRGSSIILDIFKFNLYPLYYESELSNYDPLFEINDLVDNFKNEKDLISYINTNKYIENIDKIEDIYDYCENYYNDFDENLFYEFFLRSSID